MMGLLLVPSPEWHQRLLGGGQFRNDPPRVGRFLPASDLAKHREQVRIGDLNWSPRVPVAGDTESALVLAWEGATVPEGMDRAARVLGTLEWGERAGPFYPAPQLSPLGHPDLWELRWLCYGTRYASRPTWRSGKPWSPSTRHIPALSEIPEGRRFDVVEKARALLLICQERGIGRAVVLA